MISSLVAHALLNRIQVILSSVELDRKEDALKKLRELSNFVVGRIEQPEIEDLQEPGTPGDRT